MHYANKLFFIKDIFEFAANRKQANQKKNFQIIYQQQNELAFLLAYARTGIKANPGSTSLGQVKY